GEEGVGLDGDEHSNESRDLGDPTEEGDVPSASTSSSSSSTGSSDDEEEEAVPEPPYPTADALDPLDEDYGAVGPGCRPIYTEDQLHLLIQREEALHAAATEE